MNTDMSKENSVLALHMAEQFDGLDPLLQKVHVGEQKITGLVDVKWGSGLSKLVCSAFRFPKPGKDIALSVHCQHDANSMLWRRDFAGHKMQSHFKRLDEYLVEHLGLLKLYFKAIEQNGELHYQFEKTAFLSIPLPSFLSPKVRAYEKDLDGKYHFSVEVSMPFIGFVLSYGGVLSLEQV